MDARAPGRALAEDLFRRESASLLAALVRRFGPAHLSLVEDAVQDALLTALEAWSFELPRDPHAWLLTVARNRVLDALRKDQARERASERMAEDASFAEAFDARKDAADRLAMMFRCCPAELSEETHVTLILRFLCGFGPHEIARAFLVDTGTVDRRLHRGRARLQSALDEATGTEERRARLPSVLRALYLLFNEGYHGADPGFPLRAALCSDAMELLDLVLGSGLAGPEAHALQALFCLDAARLGTRLDAAGVFVPLEEQDRSRWNGELVARGVAHLARAAEGDTVTRWHLEAGIACEHAVAPSVEETDWRRIVALYDRLVGLTGDAVVALNRSLAIAQLAGPDAGLHALAEARTDARLQTYSFTWAAEADLCRRAGRIERALQAYERAVALAGSEAERGAYRRRMRQLRS